MLPSYISSSNVIDKFLNLLYNKVSVFDDLYNQIDSLMSIYSIGLVHKSN